MSIKHKGLLLCVLTLTVILVPGCSNNKKVSLPDSPMVFEWVETENTILLTQGDKQYEPYANLDSKLLGDCIGYYTIDSDNNDGAVSDEPVYICKLDGYEIDEWVVDVINPNRCSEGTIWKERNVVVIPNELSELELIENHQ